MVGKSAERRGAAAERLVGGAGGGAEAEADRVEEVAAKVVAQVVVDMQAGSVEREVAGGLRGAIEVDGVVWEVRASAEAKVRREVREAELRA